MIGWTNVGSATTALSLGFAVIHVTAPIGSTISFSKGGVVVDVLSPDNSIVNINDSTKSDWYYSVSSDNYGTWTVTAALGDLSFSEDAIVLTNQQYNIELKFYLLKDGIYFREHNNSTQTNGKIDYEANRTRLYYTSSTTNSGAFITFNNINVSPYKKAFIVWEMSAQAGSSHPYPNYFQVGSAKYTIYTALTKRTTSLDISSINDTTNIQAGEIATNSVYVYSIWLE